MRTSWPTIPQPSIEGILVGEPSELRPAELPYLSQIRTFEIADAEPGEATFTVIDEDTGEVFTLEFEVPAGDESAAIAAIVAAVRADGKMHDLFAVSADGASTFVTRTRFANRAYSMALALPGAMTATPSLEQAAGGAGLQLAAFVASGPGDSEIVALDGDSTLSDLYGITFRTDANHMQWRGGNANDDRLVRGKHHRVLAEGRIMMVAETAVTKGDPVHVRRDGDGKIGGVRGSADGANTIDASSIASFQTSAAAGALVRLSVRMPA